MRRYDGNTGRYIYIPDSPRQSVATPPPVEEARSVTSQQGQGVDSLGNGLQKLLSGIFRQGFEVEDLLLFAVLFLMYRETKDKELLIIMGGMFLL